jgi:hypothetical protein
MSKNVSRTSRHARRAAIATAAAPLALQQQVIEPDLSQRERGLSVAAANTGAAHHNFYRHGNLVVVRPPYTF